MSIGENATSNHPNWDSAGRWSPIGFVPAGRVVWQRNRFRLHAGALRGILAWVSLITIFVWAWRLSGESVLLGIAAAMVWVAFIGPVLHETSHALAGRQVGLKLTGFGVGNRPYVFFRAPAASNTPRAWAVMAVAGPASDLVTAASFAVVWLTFRANAPLTAFCLFAGTIQACLGVYNLVPVQGNDGSIIKQARRQARTPAVEAVDDRKLQIDDRKLQVMEQTLFDDGLRGRLSESFASESSKLHIGVPARRLN
ncbi:MAG: hypothetical protein K8R99_13545 [Actinomycetia bacterium]|nr:hypothetical protein [Actinomycetes bacterium]